MDLLNHCVLLERTAWGHRNNQSRFTCASKHINTDPIPITNMDHIDVLKASVSNAQIPQFITNRLQPLLPNSLPLARRCQFHLKSKSTSIEETPSPGSPGLWIAVVHPRTRAAHQNGEVSSDPLTVGNSGWLPTWLEDAQTDVVDTNQSTEEWLAAHIDLSSPGSTQIWTFASWESSIGNKHSAGQIAAEVRTPTRVALFRTLFTYLRISQIPHLPIDPPLGWRTLVSSGKIVSTPYNRSKILFGGLAECLWPYMHHDVVYAEEKYHGIQNGSTQPECIARQDQPYFKYLIDLTSSDWNLHQPSVPSGFHLTKLSDAQLQLMLDRSVIPRTLELLKSLVSVGLFADGVADPVAWGILSKDASVASLHTEPEYRGKGLAECVTRELVRRISSEFRSRYSGVEGAEEADLSMPYAHADVSPANMASRRVFEKMGGRVGWSVAWIEVIVGEEDA